MILASVIVLECREVTTKDPSLVLCAWNLHTGKRLYARKFSTGWLHLTSGKPFFFNVAHTAKGGLFSHLDLRGTGLLMNGITGSITGCYNAFRLQQILGRDLDPQDGITALGCNFTHL